MRALVQDRHVSAEGVVHIEEIDMPVVEDDEVLVRVRSMSNADHRANLQGARRLPNDDLPFRLWGTLYTAWQVAMVTMRFVPLTLCATLLLWGCSGGELSLTEYVDRINGLAGQASQQAEKLFADAADITDFTPQVLEAGLERGLREIRIPLQEGVDAIEPPEQVADLHHRMWDWHAELIAIEEALAPRAGSAEETEAGWEMLSESPEMEAYRAAIAKGKQLCTDFQADLDATSERGGFADTPWIPGELKEVVSAALGCEWFPERPEDLYRHPPPTSAP